jgi:uncharacterized membrane protein
MIDVYPFNTDRKPEQKLLKPVGFSKVFLSAKTTPDFKLLPAPAHSKTNTKKDITWAILSYVLFLIPLLFARQTNEFVTFHTRQSFGIFMASLVVYIIEAWFELYLLAIVLNSALLAIWCVGILHALSGRMRPLPVIGNISEKYKIF